MRCAPQYSSIIYSRKITGRVAYIQPTLFVEQIPLLAQFFDGHSARWWDLLVLVARDDVKTVSEAGGQPVYHLFHK